MNHVQRLLPRHYGLLRLVLQGTMSHGQMADVLGYTPEGLRNVIQSPLFQDELARRRKVTEQTENHAIRDGITESRDLLSKLSVAAVEKMEEVLTTSADHKIALDAADKILKYAYPKEDKKGGATAAVVVLSGERLDRLRDVLSECGFTTDHAKKPVQSEVVAVQDDTTLSITCQGVEL